MCEHNTTEKVLVTIPGRLSHTETEYQKIVSIDKCISMIVRALNAFGIMTDSSCCGHGKERGHILLQDGRMLWIEKNDS